MKYLSILVLTFISSTILAQGHFSGDLQLNTSFFERDTAIGASDRNVYDNLKSSSEAWLTLNYSKDDLNAGLRFDLFNHSILHNPQSEFSGEGIGMWYISQKVKNLHITAGYFYEQFGAGLIFRAYEDRFLGIDNAVYGVRLKYALNENWNVKGFVGRQKNRFEVYSPVMKGANIDGFVQVGDKLTLLPGAAVLNRTLDQVSMDNIVATVSSYDVKNRFIPTYNMYAVTLYSTINYGAFELYGETAHKSAETILNQSGEMVLEPGSLHLASLTFSKKGIGITGQVKRTRNFTMRTSPNEVLLNGMVNFLSPLTRQNTWRLAARYSPAAQDLSEQAYQLDVIWKMSKKLSTNLNGSYVTTIEGQQLYRESYAEFKYKLNKKLIVTPGLQYMEYNQSVYEGKGGMVKAITPFMETVYKVTRRNSLRAEISYQKNEQDYGHWAWALLEYNVAPKWSFSVSDMYNIKPKKTEKLHYPTVFVGYTKGANRYNIGYVKQVEGVVCTGGVCRVEPAFSGVRLTVTSSF